MGRRIKFEGNTKYRFPKVRGAIPVPLVDAPLLENHWIFQALFFHSEHNIFVCFRFFGGLIQDVKSRYPQYLSDFKDGLHVQSIASVIFLYFACIAPIVTFGGLLGHKTMGYMVSFIEMILLISINQTAAAEHSYTKCEEHRVRKILNIWEYAYELRDAIFTGCICRGATPLNCSSKEPMPES